MAFRETTEGLLGEGRLSSNRNTMLNTPESGIPQHNSAELCTWDTPVCSMLIPEAAFRISPSPSLERAGVRMVERLQGVGYFNRMIP